MTMTQEKVHSLRRSAEQARREVEADHQADTHAAEMDRWNDDGGPAR
jgi:hypothetical protein